MNFERRWQHQHQQSQQHNLNFGQREWLVKREKWEKGMQTKLKGRLNIKTPCALEFLFVLSFSLRLFCFSGVVVVDFQNDLYDLPLIFYIFHFQRARFITRSLEFCNGHCVGHRFCFFFCFLSLLVKELQ